MDRRRAFVPVIADQASGPTLPSWLTAGGLALSDWVVAHDALYASDLASSYSNLANLGTNDLTAGVAPTWDAVNGWTFNGSTQYLVTIPLLKAYSIVLQYTDFTSAAYLLGSYEGVVNHYINNDDSDLTHTSVARGSSPGVDSPKFTSGVLIVSNFRVYRDGVITTHSIGDNGNDPTVPSFIGCVNYPPGSGPTGFSAVKIQMFGLVNRVLIEPEIVALTLALNP